MTIRTRFAPSPTGYLHIGGARTALFNYLYAKRHQGKFLLRIEDTDLNRSTPEAVEAIFNGLKWLDIVSDEEPVFQMKRQARHLEIAQELLKRNKAYRCYCTKEDLEQRRKIAESKGLTYNYDGRCKHLKSNEIPSNINPAIRIDINKSGSTIINDLVMGTIEVQNSQIDDFIILRSDGTPTYMFAVVVDDYDMKISHIIRGDDHLTNAFRQTHIYKAMDWNIPYFAHLPLIHSQDGTKMSKRLGAVAVEDYKSMGFLPQAIRNYLLRLGWSHQNDEIISDEDAIKWFDIIDINKSPARFDIVKLTSVNSHYIKNMDNDALLTLLQPFINDFIKNKEINNNYLSYLKLGLTSIKDRSKTLIELAEHCLFYIIKPPFILNDEAKNILNNNKDILQNYILEIEKFHNWNKTDLHDFTKNFATQHNLKLGKVAELIRICLCGKTVCPASNFEIMEILGKNETLQRLNQSFL